MSSSAKQRYEEYYREHEKRRYLDFLSSLSDDISFDVDIWVCEKRLRSQAQLLSKVTIYFSKISEQYKEMVKYYALIRLLEGNAVITVTRNVGNIAVFLNFMGNDAITEISVMTASRFKEYLDAKGYVESTRSGIWADVSSFLIQMNGFDGMTLRNPFYNNIYESKQLVDQKYFQNM